jgi:hypothetical protein
VYFFGNICAERQSFFLRLKKNAALHRAAAMQSGGIILNTI